MFIPCFSGKCQQPMFLLWQLGQSGLKRPDTTCSMYVYIEGKTRKSKNILMRKYLTSSDRQSVREEEKHSSIRTFAISSDDMSNVVEGKREKIFLIHSVTYLHVSTDEKYELIFSLSSIFHVCVCEYQADLSNICWL